MRVRHVSIKSAGDIAANGRKVFFGVDSAGGGDMRHAVYMCPQKKKKKEVVFTTLLLSFRIY